MVTTYACLHIGQVTHVHWIFLWWPATVIDGFEGAQDSLRGQHPRCQDAGLQYMSQASPSQNENTNGGGGGGKKIKSGVGSIFF